MANPSTGLEPCFSTRCSAEMTPLGFFLNPLSLLTL